MNMKNLTVGDVVSFSSCIIGQELAGKPFMLKRIDDSNVYKFERFISDTDSYKYYIDVERANGEIEARLINVIYSESVEKPLFEEEYRKGLAGVMSYALQETQTTTVKGNKYD